MYRRIIWLASRSGVGIKCNHVFLLVAILYENVKKYRKDTVSMIIRSSQATKNSIEEGTISDYPMPNEDIGISYQTCQGRVPTKGNVCNSVCHEIYFIISGSATFFLGNTIEEVKERDIVVVEPNTLHHIETENLQFITITRPNWYDGQYKIVE